MPANEPVLWKIQESLETDINAIAAGSGYYYTASNVEGRSNIPQDQVPGYFIVGLAGVTNAPEETQGRYYWVASFDIVATVAHSSNLTDDQARARLFADIQKAVMANPKRTLSAVDYAIDSRVLAPDIQDQYDERTGITVPVEVHYRTLISDPTTT